jgi:hypothetical protein
MSQEKCVWNEIARAAIGLRQTSMSAGRRPAEWKAFA